MRIRCLSGPGRGGAWLLGRYPGGEEQREERQEGAETVTLPSWEARAPIPRPASSSVTESGMIFRPVSIADRPSATDRYRGIVKKSPAWIRNWKKNITRPPVSCRFPSIDNRTSGSAPRFSTWCSHALNSQRTDIPPKIRTIVGERPRIAWPPGLGSTPGCEPRMSRIRFGASR
jgi:hypothetical protein